MEKKCLHQLNALQHTYSLVYGIYHSKYLIFMKQILSSAILGLLFNTTFAQEVSSEIHLSEKEPTIQMCGKVESPAYLDSTLFARYLNWNLQQDSLPISGKPSKGDSIEVWYIVSKEGKISAARSRKNEENECINFIVQKFLNCPFQWTPAYQNGRPVNYYRKMRIVF